MEHIYRKELQITAAAVDRFGRLKPSMLLLIAQEIAGDHRAAVSQDHEIMAEKGLFWAVIRTRVQINRLPTLGQRITVETWPLPTTRSAYPRATAAYDERGELLYSVLSLWIIMDVNSRAMLIPAKAGIDVEGILRGTETEAPRSLLPRELSSVLRRRVCFTDLDRNGHMNNCRYMDWIDDLLPGDFHKGHPIRELTLCYQNEAREGQELEVRWEATEQELNVNIRRDREEGRFDRVFAASVLF